MADQTTTIPNGWKTTTLGAVAEITSSKRIFANEYKNNGIPFFRGKEITEKFHGNKISTELFISEDKYKEIKIKFGVPEEGDLLLTSVGTLGNPYLVEKDFKFYFKDGNLTWFRKYKNLEPKFLFYWIISPQGKEILSYAKIGSTQEAYTISKLQCLSFNVPPLPEQRAIVAVLSSLDDKIELLREQNKTLEATAQTIFKEWFVNFNLPAVVLTKAGFPDGKIKMIDSELGKIPEGWEVDRLTDIFDFIKGIEPGSYNYSVKKLSEDYLPFYRVQDTLNYNKTPNVFVDKRILNGKIFKKDDILISLDGTIGRIFIGGSGGYSSGIRKVVGKESFISKFLIYCFLKSDKFQGELNSFAGAETTIKHAGGAIEHIKFVFKKSICEEFGKITNPLFQKMVFNNSQIQTLSTLRDALLPKLMKGESRVKI